MIPHLTLTLKEHKEILMMILMKVSDISNEARLTEVSEVWLDRLLREFADQYRRETELGIEPTPFMNVTEINKPSSQVGFIKFVVLPLYQALADLFPVIVNDLVVPIKQRLDGWIEMERTQRARLLDRRDSHKIKNNVAGNSLSD